MLEGWKKLSQFSTSWFLGFAEGAANLGKRKSRPAEHRKHGEFVTVFFSIHVPLSSSALSPAQCFLNAIVQCLSHTRGLRDYCLLKRYRQEKFANEDAKLTEGTVLVPARLLNHLLLRLSSVFVAFFFPLFIVSSSSSYTLWFLLFLHQLSLRCWQAFGMKIRWNLP